MRHPAFVDAKQRVQLERAFTLLQDYTPLGAMAQTPAEGGIVMEVLVGEALQNLRDALDITSQEQALEIVSRHQTALDFAWKRIHAPTN